MFEDDFPFPRSDMLVPWRVCQYINYSTICFALSSHWEQRFRCMDFMMTTLQRACRQVCEHVLIPRCESHSSHSYCQKKLSKNDLRLTVSIIWRNDEAALFKNTLRSLHFPDCRGPTLHSNCWKALHEIRAEGTTCVFTFGGEVQEPQAPPMPQNLRWWIRRNWGAINRVEDTWRFHMISWRLWSWHAEFLWRKFDGWRWHHVCYLLVLWVLLDD